MPAPTITTTIPLILNLPTPVDSIEEFDTKAEQVFPQLNTSSLAANQAFAEFNLGAAAVFEYSDVVLSARDAMLAVVNFAGPWAGLTGALAFPASTTHLGDFWILQDIGGLADVTLAEPGSSTSWARAVAEADSVMFDGAPFRLAATNVDAALAALACGDFVNPVLNGGMRVAQFGTSFPSLTAQTHLIDGWKYSVNSAAVVTVDQVQTATPDNPNAYWLVATVDTADASIAVAEFSMLHQNIEGYDIAEYRGKTFTLSFWVRSSVVGIHSVSLRNAALNVCHVSEFNITVPNTPQFVSITVVDGLPLTGTWDIADGVGLELDFALASGSNYMQAPGGWVAGAYIASPSQVNCLATVGNVFGITGVQINPGPVAARFRQPNYPDELRRCQRYDESLEVAIGEDTQVSTRGNSHHWKVEKRITPLTALIVEPGSGTSSGATVSFTALDKTGFYQSSVTSIGTAGVIARKIVRCNVRL